MERTSSPRLLGQSVLQPGPLRAAIVRLVDSGAGARVNGVGFARFHDHGEQVAVIGHSLVDRDPLAAKVGGLPRQVECPHVEGRRVLVIEGQGIDVVETPVSARDPVPGLAPVTAQQRTLQDPDSDDGWVRRRDRHGPDRAVVTAEGYRLPFQAPAPGTEQLSPVGFQFPGGGIDSGRIRGVEGQVVHHEIPASQSWIDSRPAQSRVPRDVDLTVAGAQIERVGFSGMDGQRTHVSAKGAQDDGIRVARQGRIHHCQGEPADEKRPAARPPVAPGMIHGGYSTLFATWEECRSFRSRCAVVEQDVSQGKISATSSSVNSPAQFSIDPDFHRTSGGALRIAQLRRDGVDAFIQSRGVESGRIPLQRYGAAAGNPGNTQDVVVRIHGVDLYSGPLP